MDRSYASGAAGSVPAAPASPSIGYPTAGNPGNGTPATKPGPYWYHQITEELLAVISSSGIAPAQGTLTQLASAIQSGKLFSSAAGGTFDALTASFAPAIAALVNGMSLYVRAVAANATTTPTFTPNSGTIAAKAIVKGAGSALAAGDIAGAGHWIGLQYDLTLDKWVLLNPATGVNQYVGVGYMMVRDEKTSGTHAGTSAVGIQTRTLNTVLANTIFGASLVSNQITLPTGTYRISARAPAFVNLTKGFFYNVTDAANAIIGYNYNGVSGAASDQAQSEAFIDGRITIASAKIFEIRQHCSEATAIDGLGAACSQGTEVYTTVEIIKES